MTLQSNFLQLHEGKIHYMSAGDVDNETIIFLHGFPEFWYAWRKQVSYFSDKYHVVAPDLRGYNKSLKPKRVKNYKIDLIAKDVIAIIEDLGKEKVILAGHDWGAAIAWHIALLYGERLSKVVVLNVPHPFVFRRTLMTNLKQLSKSWYIFFFQIPFLPTWYLGRNNFSRCAKMLVESSQEGSFTEADLEQYKVAWANGNSMNCMVMWYKAMMRYPMQMDQYKQKKVNIPIKIIWGKNDIALVPKMAEESLAYCKQGKLTYLEEATHWVQHDEPEKVNQLIEEFILTAP